MNLKKVAFAILAVLLLMGLLPIHVQARKPEVKPVGNYSVKALKSVRVGCVKQDIKAIRFEPQKGAKCSQKQRVTSAAITYNDGFSQMFDYPNAGGVGTPMAEHTLNVIPGTRCLDRISIQATTADGCTENIKVSLVL